MKVLKLIKSEFIKLFSKKSTYFLILGLIIATAGMTVLNKISNDYSGDSWDYYDMVLDDYKHIKGSLANSSNRADILKVKLLDFEIEKFEQKDEYQKENKLDASWKDEIYFQYEQAKTDCFLINLLLEGYTFEELQSACEILYDSRIYELPQLETKNEINELLLSKKKIRDEKFNQFELQDFSIYGKEMIKGLEEDILKNNNKIESLKKELLEKQKGNTTKLDEEKIKELINSIASTEMLNNAYNEHIKVYKYIVDNNIEATDNNWKFVALNSIIEEHMQIYRTKSSLYSNEDDYYKSEEYNYSKLDYNTYMNIEKIRIEELQDDIDISWYSVNNNIKIGTFDARDVVKCSVSTYLVGIVGIIVAGAIVAHEFSTGTIRFLITRPVKRYKILLAKIITVTVFVIMITILAYITVVITSGICYSITDVFIPELVVKEGLVVEQSFLLNNLAQIFLNLIPTYLFIVLAFSVSTILPHTAAAVGLGMGGLFGGYIANSMLMYNLLGTGSIIKRFPVLKYTPVPFLDWAFFAEKIDAYKLKELYGITIGMGIVVIAIYIAIMLALSFIVFIKRDIKNQ